MNAFRDLRIGTRLALTLGLCIVLLVVVATTAGLSLLSVRDSLQLVTADRYVKVKLANAAGEQLNKQARFARNILIMESADDRAKEVRAIHEASQEAARIYETLAPTIKVPEAKRMLAEMMSKREAFREAMGKFLELAQANRMQEARQYLLDNLRREQLAYMDSLDKFTDFQEKLMDESGKAANEEVSRCLVILSAAATLAALAAIALGWLLTRSITVPLAAAVGLAKKVAGGDLTARVDVRTNDETGELLRALSDMTEGLVRVVSQVRSSSDSIATGSSQIATGSADLSQRTEEQASNLQQTAASMEQLNATVKNSADTAAQATQLAGAASTAASRGGEVVGQVVGTMQQISEASRRISDIIGVIDGIAFQTNILALNAAVEAARAGEQGRGFAVVAGEVRSLAQRSAQAAKEIKSLIVDSVEKVDSGTKLADTAGQTMADIVSQVRRVADMIGEIGAATREQTTGIGQINDAVTQLDEVTQQNAALVEESTAAASSLRDQAHRLTEIVGSFRLDGMGSPRSERAVLRSEPVAVAAALPAKRPLARPAVAPKAAPAARPAPAPAASPAVATVAATADESGDWQSF